MVNGHLLVRLSYRATSKNKFKLAPEVGIEPTTFRLTVERCYRWATLEQNWWVWLDLNQCVPSPNKGRSTTKLYRSHTQNWYGWRESNPHFNPLCTLCLEGSAITPALNFNYVFVSTGTLLLCSRSIENHDFTRVYQLCYRVLKWCATWESNPEFQFRRLMWYPFHQQRLNWQAVQELNPPSKVLETSPCPGTPPISKNKQKARRPFQDGGRKSFASAGSVKNPRRLHCEY